MNEQEFAESAAGYALNALSPEDRAVFEAARDAHPEWEHWIQADTATAAALAEGVPDASPPLRMRSTLLAQIAAIPQQPGLDAKDAAVAEPAEGWSRPSRPARAEMSIEPAPTTSSIQAIQRRNWTRGLLTLAACLVLLVTIGFGAASVNEFVHRPPEVAAMEQIERAPDALTATVELPDGGSATALWSASVGKTVLISNGLPAIDEDQTYEAWFVRDDVPVSAGTFEANENGGSTALLDGTVESGDVIAVTVEPDGGSPTGEPTSEPFVAISTS